MKTRFKNELGIDLTSVLIPKSGIDINKWAVVACDQYTSEPEYWQKVSSFVGNSPSTLNLIFPEVYLERENQDEKQKRIFNINKCMGEYLDNNYFSEIENSMIYIERTTYREEGSSGKTRKGLIFAVDLDNYDFSADSQTLIRATEGTIIDRLPPRIRIREKACLELPHIMLLIDDPECKTIEPLSIHKKRMNNLYSFDLMLNGGHLEGYQLNDESLLEEILESLKKLKSPQTFYKKYNVDSPFCPLLFAVGDGNHSLATAKACWELMKPSLSKDELETHPSRYALIELVNVHDSGLEFEPIHRVLFNVDSTGLLSSFVSFYRNEGLKCGYETVSDKKNIPPDSLDRHIIPFVSSGKNGYIWADKPRFTLDVGTLQYFLDAYLKENNNVEIDYVHGDDVVERLGRQEQNMGFILSPMEKADLFKTVILEGALPRKTFSMGEAREKRFYLECRNISVKR